MRAVGVHIFAGGFTQGVKKHFDVDWHLETSDYGVETSKANHPRLAVCTDPAVWPTRDHVGPVDFVYGNPPCAVWSRAGRAGRDFTQGYDPRDSRINCFLQVFSRLRAYRPRVLVIESVCQAATKGAPVIAQLAKEAAEMGYACTEAWHNALDCGAPQDRRRVFFVFHDVALPWRKPEEPGPRTVRAALTGLPTDPSPECMPPGKVKSLELIQQTPEGGKLQDTHKALYGETTWDPVKRKHVGRPGFLYRRLYWDRPSPTHTGGCTFVHPEEHRYITIRESLVLCGYPHDYAMVGKGTGFRNLADRYAQVAQAVTPPAGAWIASVAAAGIREGKPVEVKKSVVDYIHGDKRQPRG